MTDRRNRAAYQAVATTAHTAVSEPRGWLGAIARVIAAEGSVAGAARSLGIPRRTLRRWVTGEGVPNAARQAQVVQAATGGTRRSRLTPAREKKLRAATQVVMDVTFRYDNTSREIVFHLAPGNGSTEMAVSAAGDLVDAYLAGAEGRDVGGEGDSGLFRPLARGMGDDWYRERFGLRASDPQGFDVEKVRLR